MQRKRNSRGQSATQELLFEEGHYLPSTLPLLSQLQPAQNLLAVFEDCHNYVYANEGWLKDKIFHEIVKLLLMKLVDEQGEADCTARFAITAAEQQAILHRLPNPFLRRIETLFSAVKQTYSSLFAEDAGLHLKPLTLAYVVGQLQSISLLRTPGDVKGKAFQTFITRNQRGDRGEFFTPHPIVRLAVTMLDPQPHEKVIDPTCGSGGFLIEAAAYVAQQQQDSALFDKGAYVATHLRGIEFNPDIAQAAMLRLAFEGGSGAEILPANALGNHEALYEAFDLVLTNPPFGSKGKVEDIALLKQYDLAHRWIRQPQDRWQKTEEFLPGQTPDILLLERCLALLRPGGRMAVVLPDGLLHNSSSGYVRFWLRERADVVAVLSIPQEAFVPYGTGIKTSLVFLRKRPAPALASCFMARIRNIGYDVKGQTVYRHDKSGQILRDRSGLPLIEDDIERITQAYRASAAGNLTPQGDDIFAVPSEALNSRLDVEHYLPGDRELLDRLNRAGAKRLGDIARIVTESADFRLRGEEEIRYIAISDVDARTMQVVSQQALRAHEAPSRATYRVQKGDIITAVSGASTGTSKHVTAMITDDEAGAICSNGLAVLRDIEQVDALFLLCYLRTEPFLRQVRRLMTGHAIPAISLEDLANVLVPVPPQALQREIVQTIRHIQTLRREAQTTGEQLITRLQDALSHFCNAVPQEFVCTEINSFATGALRQVSAAEGYKKRGSCPCI